MFESLIDPILAAIGVVVAGFISSALYALMSRFNVLNEADRKAISERVGRIVVEAAEERSRAAVKAGFAKWDGPTKFADAVTSYMAMIPNVSEAEARAVVAAAVHGTRETGAALGNALRTS